MPFVQKLNTTVLFGCVALTVGCSSPSGRPAAPPTTASAAAPLSAASDTRSTRPIDEISAQLSNQLLSFDEKRSRPAGYSQANSNRLLSTAERIYERAVLADLASDVPYQSFFGKARSTCTANLQPALNQMRDLFLLSLQFPQTGQKQVVAPNFTKLGAFWIGDDCSQSTATINGTLTMIGQGSVYQMSKVGVIRAEIRLVEGKLSGNIAGRADWDECERGHCKYRYLGYVDLGTFQDGQLVGETRAQKMQKEASAHNEAVNRILGSVALAAIKSAKELSDAAARDTVNPQAGSRGGVKRFVHLSATGGYSVDCNDGYGDTLWRGMGDKWCARAKTNDFQCFVSPSDASSHMCR